MKHCIKAIVAAIALGIASYSLCADQVYIIMPTTVGDQSIVRAIQQYSNITQTYVNRWKPFGLWLIGPSLRAGAVEAINNYIRVCKSLKLAHYSFPDEASLKNAFPVNWTIGALCAALKNLKEQAVNALALIAQVGANSDDVKGLDEVITSYLAIIEHNKNVLKPSCAALIKKRAEKEQAAVKLALDKATISEKKAKSWADRFGVAKGIKALLDPSLVALFGAYYFASKTGGTSDTSHSSGE